MSIRIGINGFGRMGRLALRAAWDWSEVEFVHINEVKGGTECAAHLLEFDSVHGRWSREIGFENDALLIDGKKVGFSEHKIPSNVLWGDLGVDLVIESSGKFRTTQLLSPYFERGVKKVIVAAPAAQPQELALDLVWAEIFVAALAGTTFYGIVVWIERAVTFWHPSQRK